MFVKRLALAKLSTWQVLNMVFWLDTSLFEYWINWWLALSTYEGIFIILICIKERRSQWDVHLSKLFSLQTGQQNVQFFLSSASAKFYPQIGYETSQSYIYRIGKPNSFSRDWSPLLCEHMRIIVASLVWTISMAHCHLMRDKCCTIRLSHLYSPLSIIVWTYGICVKPLVWATSIVTTISWMF